MVIASKSAIFPLFLKYYIFYSGASSGVRTAGRAVFLICDLWYYILIVRALSGARKERKRPAAVRFRSEFMAPKKNKKRPAGPGSLAIGFVQINYEFSGQYYLPLSVGMLQAYLKKNADRPGQYRFLDPLFRREKIEGAVRHLAGADVAAFSVYEWNINLSLEIARRLKALKPGVLVVFGGPQVPDRVELFLREHRFIDIVCHGEGEQVFKAIADRARERNWAAIPSVSYLRSDGVCESHQRTSRVTDLSQLPSPFLDGTFDALVSANPDVKWLGLLETNRGCPFSCAFCEWGAKAMNRVYTFGMERVRKELDWLARHRIEFVFCCDANFGLLPRDVEIAKYVVRARKKHGYPHTFSLQGSKNAPERVYEIQKLLSESGLNKGALLALQSVFPETLELIARKNISLEAFDELQRRFKRDGIDTFTDIILGLPGETYDSFSGGVARIIANGQHNRIQFNNLSILNNSCMGDPEYRHRHGLVTVRSEITNRYGTQRAEEVAEYQDLVISTRTMPPGDWVRALSFAWMAMLLHFDKLLQVPFVLLNKNSGIDYRALVEAFMGRRAADYPVAAGIYKFFEEKARDIQRGKPEYCHAPQWLNMWWMADEYMFIKLCREKRLDGFYGEAGRILRELAARHGAETPWLDDALVLSRSRIKLPFQSGDAEVSAGFNIWEHYRAVLDGTRAPLKARASRYRIDRSKAKWDNWDDWLKEVIWYGNKARAYAYDCEAL